MLLIKGKTHDILIKGDSIIDVSKRGCGSFDLKQGDDSYASRPDNSKSLSKITVIDATNLIVAPGLVDMHVHFREPGFEYKEDIQTGAAAAAAGGFTTCCFMPNTSPVIDNPGIIKKISEKTSQVPVKVLPIGAVTIGQKGQNTTNFEKLKKAGAVALSDDGLTIESDKVMRRALVKARKYKMLLISHCEEEVSMVERDVKLAAETNSKIHIAHVSTAKAVSIIRKAKKAGVKVTAETCPHYFSLTDAAVSKKGANAKMSPPLRKRKDVNAIIDGLINGTIDAIATDHAPHSPEEKALPFDEAPNGIIGLETSLAVALTFLYHTGKLAMEEIINLMSKKPAEILKIDSGRLKEGGLADIVIFDPDEEWTVEPSGFKSKSQNTPYAGMKLRGKVKYTIARGQIVYSG